VASERDRSAFAIAEVAIAVLLVASWWLPWFQVTPVTPDQIPTGAASWSTSWFGLADNGITTARIIVAIVPLVLVVTAGLALLLPWRGFVVATLVAFVATLFGADWMIERINDGMTEFAGRTTPDVGLQIFAWLCLLGALVTAVDLTRNGSSTIVWRKLRTPAINRYGPITGYLCLVVASVLIAAFPMSARWTWLVVAAMVVGLAVWVRALRKDPPKP
jgi:hypothetical protein